MISLPATGRALIVHGPEPPAGSALGELVLDGVAIRCGFTEVPAPRFDPAATPRGVLLRKRGFSVNYRDRALALATALRAPPGRFAVLGSDFVAEVLACGAAVQEFAPGDRVIGNAAFPASGEAGVRPGVPVNSASREFQVLPAAKLMRIPATMPDEVAAGFTIGAQTAASMVRRADPPAGAPVLVTAARSNTALFLIAALRRRGVALHASTTSERHHDRLRALGVAAILRPRGTPGQPLRFLQDPAAWEVMGQGGYAAVFDPFADLHLPGAVEVLRAGGAYVTCGIEDQRSALVPETAPPGMRVSEILGGIIARNLTLLGNCLGTTEDLAAAVAAQAAGTLTATLDSVRRDTGDAAGFLHRSWLAPDRFGKVVFLYR
jgi:NADPH:quinone reductase-like Zn-dependent oxidoreductase